MPPLRDLIAVFGGGVLGTAARWGLDTLIPHSAAQFPWSTLLINVIGSFALGFLTAGLWTRPLPSWVKAGVGPGLLGSFTTFSAVVLALATMTEAGQMLLALGYLAVTLLLGLGAAAAGLAAGAWRERTR
ncbi:CrcB family protein [Microbacteriaceae bacterium VKM Ac-2855]|nr:CrcB family protein [Microbacteriaceae bacterium VKM Ac-2855]